MQLDPCGLFVNAREKERDSRAAFQHYNILIFVRYVGLHNRQKLSMDKRPATYRKEAHYVPEDTRTPVNNDLKCNIH
jgi:hypothetical protein